MRLFIVFFRGFGTQDSTKLSRQRTFTLLVLLLLDKPAPELSNESLLTIVNSQDGLRGPTGLFYTYSVSTLVVADNQTVQCEHINHELWLYNAADLLVQRELELNNIYRNLRCTPS